MYAEKHEYPNTLLVGLIKDNKKKSETVSYTNIGGLNQPSALSFMLSKVGGELSYTYMYFGCNMTALMFNEHKHRLYFCFEDKSMLINNIGDLNNAMFRLCGFTC